ncbi:metallophosphoesterase [Oceanobacillus sp. CFH 90083]|uniref:metallophosphoesterase n=1 Tax=Oceanobacillus sp. CFH 90083 TaxID=2592336 RepID=UPI00128D662E|nr:metallophosphoesterase [Oceanobacillus sp. CFH 90083]
MIYILITLLIITCSILIYRAYTNTKDIQIKKIKIETENALSPASLSILHLSDLHLENISITPPELEKKLKHETPDIIALTGDFLDRKRTIPKLIPYLKVLQKMQPKHGMYAVFGNHDYVLKDTDFRKLKNLLIQFDCHVLQNASQTIKIRGQSVNIIGIDDYSTKRSDLASSFKNIEQGVNLVLTHDPTIVLEMEHYPFDYLLAGHFHGGQICYPKAYHLAKMGKLAQQNIIKGLHMHNNSPFYISEGLGQTGINIRIGSRPEITLHNMLIK